MFTLSSSAFVDHGAIPRVYTCDGDERSPPIRWSGAPASTRSLALIVDDPDAPDPRAPKQTWVHWIVYNIPADAHSFVENAARLGALFGAGRGLNDWHRADYGGPCPPIGRHRYFFELYALDCMLPDLGQPTKAELLARMRGHVLAEAQLVGTYIR